MAAQIMFVSMADVAPTRKSPVHAACHQTQVVISLILTQSSPAKTLTSNAIAHLALQSLVGAINTKHYSGSRRSSATSDGSAILLPAKRQPALSVQIWGGHKANASEGPRYTLLQCPTTTEHRETSLGAWIAAAWEEGVRRHVARARSSLKKDKADVLDEQVLKERPLHLVVLNGARTGKPGDVQFGRLHREKSWFGESEEVKKEKAGDDVGWPGVSEHLSQSSRPDSALMRFRISYDRPLGDMERVSKILGKHILNMIEDNPGQFENRGGGWSWFPIFLPDFDIF